MQRRTEIQKSVFVALIGSAFFLLLFLLAAQSVLAAHTNVRALHPSSAGPVARQSPDAVLSRSISGELGGWMRSGPFTLVVRGGAYEGREILELTPLGDLSCRIGPEDLEAQGVLLRCEMDLSRPVVAERLRADGSWEEVVAERFLDRGYAQIVVPRFGTYRFESR